MILQKEYSLRELGVSYLMVGMVVLQVANL